MQVDRCCTSNRVYSVSLKSGEIISGHMIDLLAGQAAVVLHLVI